MINPISFKGTFCINNSDNFRKNSEKIFQMAGRYKMTVDRVQYRDQINEVHITVPDKKDAKMSRMLENREIPYAYINVSNPLNKHDIYDRMSIDNLDKLFGYELVDINVRLLDEELRKNPNSYIGAQGQNGSKEKYDRFVRFLHTNHKIDAPTLSLIKTMDGKPAVYITDGRHRFAVLRDIGMKKIPVRMSEKSINTGKELGIF